MSLDETRQEDVSPIEKAADATDNADRFSIFDEPIRPDDKPKKKRRLKARTRSLIAAVAVAAGTALLLLTVTLLPQQNAGGSVTSAVTSTATDETEHLLIDRTKDNAGGVIVQSIQVDNANGKYSIAFNKSEGAYELIGYEDLELSINAGELAEYCASLTAYHKIADTSNMASFGLDDPASSVTATYHDGSTVTIHIGDKIPTEEGFYIRLGDSRDVYVLDLDTANYFLAADWWYVSTTLFEPPKKQENDETGTALLKSLHLTGSGYDYDLSLRRPTADDSSELSFFKYVTTEPFLRGVHDSVGDDLYGFISLYASRAAILHPTAAEKAKYGFNDPLAIVTVTLAIENSSTDDDGKTDYSYYNHCTYTLKVGGVDTDDNYLVMMDGKDVIYQVERDAMSTIVNRTHENTTTALLFLKDVSTVSKIHFTHKDKTVTFDLTHYPNKENDDDKLAVYVDGKKHDTANFRKLYVLMMGMERYGKLEEAPSGKPETTFALYDSEGKLALHIDCYSTSGSLCSVKTSDGELFTIRSGTLSNLLNETENFLNGKPVQS